MTINEIKAKIARENGTVVETLAMVRQMEEDKATPTPWLSSWNNTDRIRVTMHEDVMTALKNNPNNAGLAIKYKPVDEHKTTTGETIAAYKHYIVITPANIEATF